MRALHLIAVAALCGASLLAPRAIAQTNFHTLYTFGPPPDGQNPTGVVAANGAFYGTTILGGAGGGYGSVFQLQPPSGAGGTSTENLLYSFHQGDGSQPTGPPVVGPDGTLYGTTENGGTYGYGTVYALQPPASPGSPWTEMTLYNFAGLNDGMEPMALVAGDHGEFYGVAIYGGTYGNGIVFMLQPPATPGNPWTETPLYSFGQQEGDGADPIGITRAANGTIYGATLDLFAGHAGTIFELTPPVAPGGAWTETVLHRFGTGKDGCYPFFAPTIASDGSLYGTTYGTIIIITYPGYAGDGTVFKLTPPATPGGAWTKTILYSFGETAWGPDSTDPEQRQYIRHDRRILYQ